MRFAFFVLFSSLVFSAQALADPKVVSLRCEGTARVPGAPELRAYNGKLEFIMQGTASWLYFESEATWNNYHNVFSHQLGFVPGMFFQPIDGGYRTALGDYTDSGRLETRVTLGYLGYDASDTQIVKLRFSKGNAIEEFDLRCVRAP